MPESNELARRMWSGVMRILRDAVKTSVDLFVVMVPVIVAVKILKELGVDRYLGMALAPLMELVGLPGSMGVVWGTAILTNLYGGMAAFAELAPKAAPPLTVAQVTVLCTMMLVAHNLLVEVRIAQKAGTRFRFMLLLRLVAALAIGVLLNLIYRQFGWLGGPNVAVLKPAGADPSWGAWALGQGKFLLLTFIILLALLVLMRLLKWLRITDALTRLLGPLLRLLGMTRAAAPVTIIGMTLGLAYGGGLIIREARSGRLTARDVFFSLALMGLCHSLIDDTALMMTLGAHVSGVLLARTAFALLIGLLLVQVVGRVSEATFNRFFVRSAEEPRMNTDKNTDEHG